MMLTVTPSYTYLWLHDTEPVATHACPPFLFTGHRFVNVVDAVSESDKGQHSITFSDTIFMANAFFIFRSSEKSELRAH